MSVDMAYIDLLLGEYVQRKTANSRYSERAFAKSLGLSPGFLNLLFQGKKRLSLVRAKEISAKLNWTESRRTEFLNRVQITRGATAISKDKFLLGDKDFFEVSDWFHFAIIEFVKVRKGKITAEDICTEFSISKSEAHFSLKHLERLGILKHEAGKYSAPEAYEVPSMSSVAVRKYHRQQLTKAVESIETQNLDERDLRGLTLAFDSGRLTDAKKDIQKFVASFEKKYASDNSDSVYQLSLALFRLSKGPV